jgi:LysM repeat protein
MKKTWSSKLLIAGLALVLVLAAGCDRPDANATLATPTFGAQAVAGTPTLGPNEMPAGLQLTAAANAATLAPVNPTRPAPVVVVSTATPLPPQEPQPAATPLPAAPAISTPVPATAVPAQQPVTVPAGGTTYIVQSGDRLFSIGRMFNVDPYAIAQTNNIHAPFIIYPGQKLTIPGSSGATPVPGTGNQRYTVQPGDNLFRIALRFGRSMQAIAAANNIANTGLIFVGQVLIIP